jgi:hypothetical protein
VNRARWQRLETGEGTRLEDLLAIQHLFGIDSVEAFFGPYPSRRIMERKTVSAVP